MSITTKTPENSSSKESNGLAAEHNLTLQVQGLNARVAALERELAASQQKCDQYRQFVTQWALTRHSQAELERFAMDDDETGCLSLDRFIGELEAMVHNEK